MTLNEKIRFRMAVDRRPILTRLADKWAVRAYVTERVGPEVLTEVYAVVSEAHEIPWSTLPQRFVIKASHGSGATVVVDDRAPLSASLPSIDLAHPWGLLARVHPSRLDRQAFENMASVWLTSNYWRFHGRTEWAYRDIPPRLIVEELLEDRHGNIPPDYKIWCFNGRVGFVQVDLNRLHGHRRSMHRPDWSVLDGSIHYPTPEITPERPKQLAELLEVSELLAGGLDFVRVDLYALEERIVFGELTHYPGIGGERMHPEDLFTPFGADWRPVRRKR